MEIAGEIAEEVSGVVAEQVSDHRVKMQRTESVCPVCLERVPALRRQEADGSLWMVKTCPEHGEHRDILWKGYVDYEDWRGDEKGKKEDKGAFSDCGHCAGLCQEHERDTCCTLLEVTARCNMGCRFCFAEPDGSPDPSLEVVKAWIQDLTIPGKTFLQLSGGEPTVREDLPQIISWAKACGCRYVQLNSNGLRLAQDPEYGKALARAGLDFLFLQFDGVTEEVYRSLRGREMLSVKEQAIRNMGSLGVAITLVPVIVPGLNDHQVGEILRYGIAHSPMVRGVHYQPVSYFGRLPKQPGQEDRYTLDQLVRALVDQSRGQIPLERLQPSCCDHPMCGLHSDFAVLPEGILHPLSPKRKGGQTKLSCGDMNPADQNRKFIGERWKRDLQAEEKFSLCQKPLDMTDMDTFLTRLQSHRFTVTAMAFQDAGNMDYERLRRCSLHVYRQGKKRPFCAAYLSAWGEKGKIPSL